MPRKQKQLINSIYTIRVSGGNLLVESVSVKFSRTPIQGKIATFFKSVLMGKYKSFYEYCHLLPASGNRNNSNGTLNNRGNNGNYWSSTENGTNAYNLNFNSGSVNPANNNNRLNGFSVRCVAALNPVNAVFFYSNQNLCELSLRGGTTKQSFSAVKNNNNRQVANRRFIEHL